VKPDDTITRAEFAAPHPDLRRYVTTYYVAEVESPNGEPVKDLLHPEWGSARFLCRGEVLGSIIPEPMVPMPSAIVAGPTSRASPVQCISMRIVSFGMLPLGWHRFMAQPAHRYADRSVEACDLSSRIDLTALLPRLKAATSLSEISSIFDDALLAVLHSKRRISVQEENEIEAAHRALADPEISSVAELAAQVGITMLQLERLSKKVFGFPPKLLLRRQRFLRTLAIVLREPRSKWGEILDPQYYDQAHFNRDFRRFFGMSPREYLAMPRPIVATAARERMRTMDGPLQGLQMP
jgi:AraC-like DNA-binding protein